MSLKDLSRLEEIYSSCDGNGDSAGGSGSSST